MICDICRPQRGDGATALIKAVRDAGKETTTRNTQVTDHHAIPGIHESMAVDGTLTEHPTEQLFE
jgi:hypothetical protein